MTAPTIDTTQSILGYRAYETFSFQPGVYNGGTGNDTVWTASGLPSGLSINATTALITGSVSAPGIYVVQIRGSNTTFPTPVVAYFTIGIEAGDGSSVVAGSSDTGIDINVDVCTREVTTGASTTTTTAPTGATITPLLLLKEDDTAMINLRFKKGGVALDPVPTSIKLAFKSVEPEAALFVAGGIIPAEKALTTPFGVASTDVLTCTAHGFVDGDIVCFQSLTGGAGLSTAGVYYVRDKTADTFKLSATLGGAAIDFSTDITDGIISITPAFAKIGSGASAVFQVPVVVTSAALAAALSDNEADAGTKFDALCEIEWKQSITPVGGISTLIASSKTFAVTIERDLVV